MAKGEKTGGRQPGTPNKVTRELKESILTAFETLGGAAYLVEQAKENPSAFMSLLGRILPRDVKVDGEVGVSVTVVTGLKRDENG